MQDSLLFLKEALPYLLALAAIGGCGTTATVFFQKREYFLKEFNQVNDIEEKNTIIWYSNFLKRMFNTQLIGMAVFVFLIFIFSTAISGIVDLQARFLLGILSLLITIVSWIIWRGRKGNQKDLNESVLNDGRAPVLFLRAFDQDGEAPLTIFDAISKNSKKLITYEDMAIGYAKMVGPVIAIAAPYRTQKEILGAAKGHVQDWQTAIHSYMEKSSLIIMRPNGSEGLLWEFEQLIKLQYLHKTILYLNLGEKVGRERRKAYKENEAAYYYFRKMVSTNYGIELGEYNPKAQLIFFQEQNDAYETDDYFDIPVFRKIFYRQYIVARKNGKLTV